MDSAGARLIGVIPTVILSLMKTAVSIPDDVYDEAERLAEELGLSRSALYTQALKALLDECREELLIERINAVCARTDTSLEPGLAEAQARAVQESSRKRSE